MSQEQSRSIADVTVSLKQATEELEQATEELEQANKLWHALDQAGVLSPEALKSAQEEAVTTAKTKQKEAAKKVAEAQGNVLTAYENGQPTAVEVKELKKIRKRAVEVLMRVPPELPLKYDKKKMAWVLIGLTVVLVGIGFLIGYFPGAKPTVIVGLIVAAVGQLCESAKKADDLQSRPRLMDGIALFGEGTKFLGALAVLVGALVSI